MNGQRHQSRRRLPAIAAIVAGLLTVALLGVVPLAHADDLDDQKDAKQSQIAQTKTDIAKTKSAVDAAAAAVAAAKAQLATAQADLTAKQQAVTAALAEDAALAADLAVAQQQLAEREAELAVAQAEVAQGEAKLAAQRDQIGLIAQSTAQQNTTLLSLAMLFGDFDTAKLNNQAQWATTLFTANEYAMEQLRVSQTQLVAAQATAEQAKADAAAAEAIVQTKKDAAAAHLAVTQQAQAAAAAAAKDVAAKVSASQKAQADAQALLDKQQAELDQQQADLADIQAKIQARIAAQQAAGGGADQTGPTSGTFFQRPVPGPVTSYYGYRIHPITGVRQFHSGVDFGESCGNPILAAADGVVTQASWYGGYGNYTTLDLGRINGSYWSVGYGHQSKFLVSVGQHVTRGQVIGLVGTTGTSTGCHVHFNVFQNGSTVNGLPLVS